MTAPLFISFATIGNGYEAEAAELVKTLDAFELPHSVVRLLAFSGWQQATQHKPVFIREMMDNFPGRPLVWIDADARLWQSPALLKIYAGMEIDVAAHWLGDRELLTGTLLFNPTPGAVAIVDAWIERNRENPDGQHGDQRNFQDVVEATPALRTMPLPASYCWIADISPRFHEPCQPAIEQTQASRRLRS